MATGVKKIKYFQGIVYSKMSVPNQRLTIAPDEWIWFDVAEWETGTQSGDKNKNLTWLLQNTNRTKILLQKVSSNSEKFGFKLPKNLCGNYHYYIEASLSGKQNIGNPTGLYVKGYCEPKIVISKWGTENDSLDVRKTHVFSYGDIIHLGLETEGMNGDTVTVAIFRRVKRGGGASDDQHIHTYTSVKVIDGEINLKIGNTYAWYAKIGNPGSVEEFYVKVKAVSGKYISDGKDTIHARFLRIKNTIVSKKTEIATNNTPVKIGASAKSTTTTGFISLERIAVHTKYDVCNDEIKDFSDLKDFWILENGGKYYHWLKKRTNPQDLAKPDPLPITITSLDKIKIEATFKTSFPSNNLTIRVKDKMGKYTFKPIIVSKQTKNKEFPITFISDNEPFKNTVHYSPNFELIFELSFNGKSWMTIGSAKLCLYVTYSEPGYSLLSLSTIGRFEYLGEDGYKEITSTMNHKKCILETFLFIGCKYGKGSKNTDEIVNNVFNHIKSLKVERARKKRAMGYWRKTSSLHEYKMHFRGVRYLLNYGEARCGEWSSFFQDICRIQSGKLFPTGIFERFTIEPKGNIDSKGYTNTLFLVKEWAIKDPFAPKDLKQRAQDVKNIPMNLFWDHVFTKYGNKYFDASYGLSSGIAFVDDDALLKHYTGKALSGVVYIKLDPAKPLINAIAYKPQSGKYIDPSGALNTIKKNNYRYKTVTVNMQKELHPDSKPA